ncbi:hypothetical protein MA16_Dca002823 [Dendrobium catenatum]|uniref:Uncharacterized protein n=1 Tax=Dendrobium catenatum TaxID=906689 RepID=A0A2I0X8V0_9ASPA|nr:hypothetical protein MA16_Dca002823 [Dendrobium catenatum]
MIQCLSNPKHVEWSTIGSIQNNIHKYSWVHLSNGVEHLIPRAVFNDCLISGAVQAKQTIHNKRLFFFNAKLLHIDIIEFGCDSVVLKGDAELLSIIRQPAACFIYHLRRAEARLRNVNTGDAKLWRLAGP